MRDNASKVRVAAQILNRRDIVMTASFLMARAERAIYDTTPAQQGKLLSPEDRSLLPPSLLPKVRQANNGVSAAQFERFLADGKEQGKPWTRQRQIEEATRIRKLDTIERYQDTAPVVSEPRATAQETADTAPTVNEPRSIADEIEEITAIDDVPKPLPVFEPVDGTFTPTQAREWAQSLNNAMKLLSSFRVGAVRIKCEIDYNEI